MNKDVYIQCIFCCNSSVTSAPFYLKESWDIVGALYCKSNPGSCALARSWVAITLYKIKRIKIGIAAMFDEMLFSSKMASMT